MSVIDPENRPEQPKYLGNLSISLPAGATFKQAAEHMTTCQYIDSLGTRDITELREVAKALSALCVGMQVCLSHMLRQELSNIPTIEHNEDRK